jgi:hypothetical protein
VDLFWLKADMQQNPRMFLDCLESLMGRDTGTGFRGIQSKGLMDIIQMECLSRSSTMLRLTRGPLVARLWIQKGELIDAEVEGARGEAALRKVLAWKSGTFENLPAEPKRERTITKSINILLLESAQTMDEAVNLPQAEFIERTDHRKTVWKLALVAREGVEFVITVSTKNQSEVEVWGAQSIRPLVGWTRSAAAVAKRLGERLAAGPLSHVAGDNVERRVLLLPRDDKSFLVAWPPGASANQLLEKTKKLAASWDS